MRWQGRRGATEEKDYWDLLRLEKEIARFENSEERAWMHFGQRYYLGENEITGKPRVVIGEGGALVHMGNMSDQRLSHAFLRELIDQKCQYLLGRSFSLQCEDEEAQKLLSERFLDEDFAALLFAWAKDALINGIAYIQLYYDAKGMLRLRRMRADEILPIWEDEEHRNMRAVVRTYQRERWEKGQSKKENCVTLWDENGQRHFIREGATLRIDPRFAKETEPHFWEQNGQERLRGSFGRPPFVALKANDEQTPLIRPLKSLIDAYDRAESDRANALADQPNSLLVLRNYDGQNLGEFRRNLAAYRAVKVSGDGGVEALQTPVEAEASNAMLDRLRRDIYAFGRGVDHRNLSQSSATSGIALRHEYAALDLDANTLERQIKVAMGSLIAFLYEDWRRKGLGDFDARVDFSWNRDILTNEEAAIEMIGKSEGLLSRQTLLAQHPWVRDVELEKERLLQEKEGREE